MLQALYEIDDLLKYLDRAENDINSADAVSADPETLAVQLSQHKVWRFVVRLIREKLLSQRSNSTLCALRQTFQMLTTIVNFFRPTVAQNIYTRHISVVVHH
jgi:hypothetical protein